MDFMFIRPQDQKISIEIDGRIQKEVGAYNKAVKAKNAEADAIARHNTNNTLYICITVGVVVFLCFIVIVCRNNIVRKNRENEENTTITESSKPEANNSHLEIKQKIQRIFVVRAQKQQLQGQLNKSVSLTKKVKTVQQ